MILNNKEIFLQSIVNHVYFAGSIRSFCTAIGLTFFRNNQDFIDRAIALGERGNKIAVQSITLAYPALANEIIKNDVFTPETDPKVCQCTWETAFKPQPLKGKDIPGATAPHHCRPSRPSLFLPPRFLIFSKKS